MISGAFLGFLNFSVTRSQGWAIFTFIDMAEWGRQGQGRRGALVSKTTMRIWKAILLTIRCFGGEIASAIPA